ncbi:MAG: MBOAT family protein [Clostridiales bacterium]|nr:MBOAT family protein [Clostridiales bacterium]
MVFSSLLFLFLYLPIVLGIYYITPRKFRNLFLFVVNLIFYGWGEPVFVLIMIFSTISDYIHGWLIDKYRANKKVAKALVVSAVVINLSLLGFFKYAGFFASIVKSIPIFSSITIPQIPLPIGISFYTFQTMSYSIDVYRGDAPVQKNIISFGTYVALFPQLIAGPIVRYKDVAYQLDHRRETLSQFAQGVRLFLVGLAKKVLIANQMGLLWDNLRATSAENGVLGCWIGIIAFSFQIYFDFSGYSDMARGLGNMLGFEFLKNFDYPYISKSITEFWRRWHISLGTWFREYVYIPLGGNRRGKARLFLNLFVVWFLTGLWHGASWNFVLWGLYFGVILVIEKFFLLKYLQKTPAWVQHLYSLLLIVLGWVIFYFEDTSALFEYFGLLFHPAGGLIGRDAFALIVSYLPLLIAAGIASVPLASKLWTKIQQTRWAWAAETVLSAACLLLCTASLVSQSYNPFLYFRF